MPPFPDHAGKNGGISRASTEPGIVAKAAGALGDGDGFWRKEVSIEVPE